MAECSGLLGKRKPSKTSSKPVKRSRPTPPQKTCCLKSCPSKTIDPQSDCYVEIKATLSEMGQSNESAVTWAPNGEALFHSDCWQCLLKSSRARNPKNITISLSQTEKAILKEAAKTVERHDSADIVSREATRIATLLKRSTHCVVFSGAGISTSAGIGDYRGKGGKWTEEDRGAALRSGDHLASEDEGVPYESLRPTYTHEALVKLMEMGFLKHIISQNGDGLHGLSGVPPENLSELHGNVFVEVCEKCDLRYMRPFYVLDDLVSQYYEEIEDCGSTDIAKPKHAAKCVQCGLCHRTGRKCEKERCGGHLKDSIINFGDDLEESILTQAEHHADCADLCLSLGTTMQVTPACELVQRGKEPLRLVIVNRQTTGFDDLCLKQADDGGALGSRVFGDCDEVLAEVMTHLLTDKERKKWEAKRSQRMKDYDRLRDKLE